MKVADAIKQMSKQPLQRIVDSFTKDFRSPTRTRRGTSSCEMSRNSPTGNESRPFCSSTVPSRTRSGRY